MSRTFLKKNQKVSKYPKEDLRALNTLQKFGYSVVRQIRALEKVLKSYWYISIEKTQYKTKKRIWNSLIVPNNLQGGLRDFLTFFFLQNIQKQLKGDLLEALKNFRKKKNVSQSRRGAGS